MNLYAVEHPEGREWLTWIDLHSDPDNPALAEWIEGNEPPSSHCTTYLKFLADMVAERVGGTVVTFTLTRTPELKVGAKVVRKNAADVVMCDPYVFDEDDALHVTLSDGSCVPTNCLIVLPEEVES